MLVATTTVHAVSSPLADQLAVAGVCFCGLLIDELRVDVRRELALIVGGHPLLLRTSEFQRLDLTRYERSFPVPAGGLHLLCAQKFNLAQQGPRFKPGLKKGRNICTPFRTAARAIVE